MTTLRTYLAEKAKFHTPPTEGADESSSDINDFEADVLDDEWKPVGARRDVQMVDSLLRTLDVHLGERLLPVDQALLDCLFQPIVDRNGQRADWTGPNSDKHTARTLVSSGHLTALLDILDFLHVDVTRKHEFRPSNQNIIKSMADYVLYPTHDQNKKMLVEVKAPSALEHALLILQHRSFRLSLGFYRSSDEKTVNKVCFHMAANKIKWAALTSQNKWVFFQLHPGNDTFVSFSAVEEQQESTRPFRALLAIMLATIYDLDVESHVDMGPLHETREKDEYSNEQGHPQVDPKKGKSGTYRGSSKPYPQDKYFTRKDVTCTLGQCSSIEAANVPDLLIGWSPTAKKNPRSFAFYEVGGVSQDPTLGTGIAQLHLQRALGKGLTGVVYEAKIAVGQGDKSANSNSYALKAVVKGSYEERMGYLGQLRKEFVIYCEIEEAKKKGRIASDVVPRCYGLYESNSMLVLVMDCEGSSLTDEDWKVLSTRDKVHIFELLAALHKIGIGHYDFEPRNIVHSSIGSFKIIDFAFASYHNCAGIKELSWFEVRGHEECAELRSVWDQLNAE